jgi:hypothetical protein
MIYVFMIIVQLVAASLLRQRERAEYLKHLLLSPLK